MKCILAHEIVYEGHIYPMHIARLSDDGQRLILNPYERETASTIFIPGRVEVWTESGKLRYRQIKL